MIGILLSILLNSFKSSIPSNLLLESHTSRITKFGLSLNFFSASSEFKAISVRYFSSFRISDIKKQISFSSSIISILFIKKKFY